MSDGTKWEVTSLKVETSTADAKTDSLYANGRMQNQVNVTIKAVVQGTIKNYQLSSKELRSIVLIDYDDSPSTLSSGWSFTEERNEFGTTMSATTKASALARQDSPTATSQDGAALAEELSIPPPSITQNATAPVGAIVDQNDDGHQTRRLWVSTTKIESKRIGARVTQPDGKVLTTHSRLFDSHITLKGIEPIIYTTDKVNIIREDTADGSYRFDWQSAWDLSWDTAYKHWDQDNYFVSSKAHEFIKAEIYGFDTTGGASGHPSDAGLTNCYAYCAPDDKNLKLSFIWEFGSETTKNAGLYKKDVITDWGVRCGRVAYAHVDIKVNQKRNSLCLTRLAIDCPDSIWGGQWSNKDCGFTIYDLYGNAGKFSASYSDDHNLVIIANAN